MSKPLEWNLEIETKLHKLEVWIQKTIPKNKKHIFVRALFNEAAFNQYCQIKPNEVCYLDKIKDLETYGDAVLDLIVCKMIFHSHEKSENMTDTKKKYVENSFLNRSGSSFLQEIAIIRNYSSEDQSSYANVLEQLIGAMFEVFGLRFTTRFLKENKIIE